MSPRTASCLCGNCRKCRDRNRKQALKAGTHQPYVAKGRERERKAAIRRDQKLMKRSWKTWTDYVKLLKRASKMVQRRRRNFLFKRNTERFGLEKAKLIAVCVTKKKKGKWKTSYKSARRFKRHRADKFWFAGESWAGFESDES